MMVHAGGLTLAPGSIGDTDTLALVNAPGAKGARLTIGDGVIGSSGYAIMPYLTAYRENTVGIDISSLESDVEVKAPAQCQCRAVVPSYRWILKPTRAAHCCSTFIALITDLYR